MISGLEDTAEKKYRNLQSVILLKSLSDFFLVVSSSMGDHLLSGSLRFWISSPSWNVHYGAVFCSSVYTTSWEPCIQDSSWTAGSSCLVCSLLKWTGWCRLSRTSLVFVYSLGHCRNLSRNPNSLYNSRNMNYLSCYWIGRKGNIYLCIFCRLDKPLRKIQLKRTVTGYQRRHLSLFQIRRSQCLCSSCNKVCLSPVSGCSHSGQAWSRWRTSLPCRRRRSKIYSGTFRLVLHQLGKVLLNAENTWLGTLLFADHVVNRA